MAPRAMLHVRPQHQLWPLNSCSWFPIGLFVLCSSPPQCLHFPCFLSTLNMCKSDGAVATLQEHTINKLSFFLMARVFWSAENAGKCGQGGETLRRLQEFYNFVYSGFIWLLLCILELVELLGGVYIVMVYCSILLMNSTSWVHIFWEFHLSMDEASVYPWTLGAALSRAIAPGRVSQCIVAPCKGPDQEWFKGR